jgi:hypothetical protein
MTLPSVSFRMVAYLAGGTAVLLLLLVWLTYALAQRPLLQTNPDTPRLPGWTAVTAPDDQYALKLPPRWQWAFATQELAFRQHLNRPNTQAVLTALFLPAEEIWPHLLASAPDGREWIALVGMGNAVTDSHAMYTAVSKQDAVTNVTQSTHHTGYEQINYQQTIPISGGLWRCQVQLHLPPQAFYWVAVCGPAAEAPASERNSILDSFQPLSP